MKSKKTFYGIITLIFFTVLGFTSNSYLSNLLGYNNQTFWSSKKTPHRILNRIVADRSNVTWACGNHTASPLPLGILGPEKYAKQLGGINQNTKIAEVLKSAVKDDMNVILVVGDGMGVDHMSLPIYKNIALQNGEKTYFEKIMNEGTTGLVLTNTHNTIVTGSAAAATAFACGTKTLNGMVGVDSDMNRLESILDVAENNGKSTGLVTDAHITDGTPCAFYGHSISRHFFAELSKQLILENDIEVLFGGGAEYFIPQDNLLSNYKGFEDIHSSLDGKSKRKDSVDLIDSSKAKGYKVINTEKELLNIEEGTEKVLGLFSAQGMNARIDRDDENTGEPSLVDMTKKAIDILAEDVDGFFLMVEAARIDWEAHDNDIGAVFKSLEEMNDVLEVCYNTYLNDPENTILVFTADHETGGLGITYSHYHDKKIEKTFANGQKYITSLNSLPFEDFNKLYEQNKSIYKILTEVHSLEELHKELNDALTFEITKEESEIIYKSLDNYRKSK